MTIDVAPGDDSGLPDHHRFGAGDTAGGQDDGTDAWVADEDAEEEEDADLVKPAHPAGDLHHMTDLPEPDDPDAAKPETGAPVEAPPEPPSVSDDLDDLII